MRGAAARPSATHRIRGVSVQPHLARLRADEHHPAALCAAHVRQRRRNRVACAKQVEAHHGLKLCGGHGAELARAGCARGAHERIHPATTVCGGLLQRGAHRAVIRHIHRVLQDALAALCNRLQLCLRVAEGLLGAGKQHNVGAATSGLQRNRLANARGAARDNHHAVAQGEEGAGGEKAGDEAKSKGSSDGDSDDAAGIHMFSFLPLFLSPFLLFLSFSFLLSSLALSPKKS